MQDELAIHIDNVIHTLTMLKYHRYVYFNLELYLENSSHDRNKVTVATEMCYLDAIEVMMINDIALKVHCLLEPRGSEDYILNKKYNLQSNQSVCGQVKSLKNLFDLQILFSVRNRYIAHLDVNHNLRNKSKIPIPEDEKYLQTKTANFFTIENINIALKCFGSIHSELQHKDFYPIEQTQKVAVEFWRRYIEGIQVVSSIKIPFRNVNDF